MRKVAKTVGAYIAGAPKLVQKKLKELRRIIKHAAPGAEEKLSYGMPYYSYHGRLAYFAYFRDHLSLFAMPPIPELYKRTLGLHVTGKSTIQFSFHEKLPARLITQLIKARARRNKQAR